MARRKRGRTRAKPKRRVKALMPATSTGDSKTFAFVATFFSIIGFVLALILWRKDRYVMYYARQSLVLFVVWIFVWIVTLIIIWIPILGQLVIIALIIAVFVLWIMTWIYALSGKKKDVSVIGHYAKHINL